MRPRFITWLDGLRQRLARRTGPLPFARRRAAHLRLGSRGERLAARVLRRLGIDVLVCNYRDSDGEMDMVARDDLMLCFVEVKTRHRALNSRPADAVRSAKRRRIVRTAHRYLREIGHPQIAYRFDIVEVVFDGRRLRTVRYLRNAFTEAEVRRSRADVFPSVLD